MLFSILTIGQQIIILFLLMSVGFVLGKTNMIDDRASLAMSNLVMYVVTPSILITSFQRELVLSDFLDFGTVALLGAVSMGLCILFGYFVLHRSLPARQRVLRFAVVFSNNTFMGYPLMSALLGPIGIFLGSAHVAVFQMLLWTWGMSCMTGDRKRMKLKPILLSPGIIGVAIAMALYLLQITIPDILLTPLRHLGNMNTPLPMVIIGYQLSHADLRKALSGLDTWLCAILRMLVTPLLTLALCMLLQANTTVTTVLVIASSAPAAAVTSMFAAKFDADTALASGVVSVQTLLSILTMPVMIALAQYPT